MNINLLHVNGLFLYPLEYKQTLTGLDVGRNFNFIECVFIMQKKLTKSSFLAQLSNFMIIKPFYATSLFLYRLKTSENQGFSDVFRGLEGE